MAQRWIYDPVFRELRPPLSPNLFSKALQMAQSDNSGIYSSKETTASTWHLHQVSQSCTRAEDRGSAAEYPRIKGLIN